MIRARAAYLRNLARNRKKQWSFKAMARRLIRPASERNVESQSAHQRIWMLAEGTRVENALHIGL